MPALTLERLSYSTEAKHSACPKKLFLSKGTPYKGVPTWAGVGGRAAHTLFEEYDRAGLPAWDEETWTERSMVIFAEAINTEQLASGVHGDDWRVSGRASKAWPNKEDFAWWCAHLPEMGKAYAAWRAAHPELVGWITPDGEEAIELELKLHIPGVETPYLGFVDKIFQDMSKGGALVVTDYKSGSMAPEDLSQLITYASLVEIRYGVRPEFGAIYSARKGELIPIMRDGLTLMPLSHVSTETWIRGVQSRERIIALGEFPASPGRHCGWCDVRRACTWAKGPDAYLYDPDHPAYRAGTERSSVTALEGSPSRPSTGNLSLAV